jgi:hypothetical protein
MYARRLPLYNWLDLAKAKAAMYCIRYESLPYPTNEQAAAIIAGELDIMHPSVRRAAPRVVPGWTAEEQENILFKEYAAIPVPTWVDNFLMDVGVEGPPRASQTQFPYVAFNWKTTQRNLAIGGTDFNAYLREFVEHHCLDGLGIHIHPDTAADNGIKDGDRIRVISQHHNSRGIAAPGLQDISGRVEGIAKVTHLITPGTVGFPGQGGSFSSFQNPNIAGKGSNYNQLLHNQPPFILPDNGATSLAARCRIEKI